MAMTAIGHRFLMVNMEQFVKHNYEDATESIEVLKKQKYWEHFVALSEFYRDLVSSTDPEFSVDQLKYASLHYLNGNMLNLVKGVSTILSGHFLDGNIFIRRTVESMRYLIFMRENPNEVKSWFDKDKVESFEKKYRDWIRSKKNQNLLDSIFDRCNFHFNHASSYGLHSNGHLFSLQHYVEHKDDQMFFTVNFRDYDETDGGYVKFISAYFWHLETHFKMISWWIYKSTWCSHLSPQQISYWAECRKKFDKDKAFIKNRYKVGFLD